MTTANLASLGRELAALRVEMYRLGAAARSFTVEHSSVNVKDFGAVGDGETDDWPAFKAAHDSFSAAGNWMGGRLKIPAGDYFLSRTWEITKRMTIVGDGAGDGTHVETAGTVLSFPSDTTGIRLYSSYESPDGGASSNTEISGILLRCTDYAATESGKGLWASNACQLTDVKALHFGEQGILIRAWSGHGVPGPAFDPALSGNANGWSMYQCGGHINKGNGIHIEGSDANSGIAFRCQSSNNLGWQYYDASQFTNLYLGCGCESPIAALGSYKCVSPAGVRYLNCYLEIGGMYATSIPVGNLVDNCVFDAFTNGPILTFSDSGGGTGATAVVNSLDEFGAINGILMLSSGTGYTGAAACGVLPNGANGGVGAVLVPVLSGGKVVSVTISNGGAGYECGWAAQPMIALSGAEGGFRTNRVIFEQMHKGSHRKIDLNVAGATFDSLVEARAYSSGVGAPDAFGLCAWNEDQGCWETEYNGNQVGTGIGLRWKYGLSTTQTGGRSSVAAVPNGSVSAPNGMWFGDGANSRQYLGPRAAAPVAGEYAHGDWFSYLAPVAAGKMGGVCVVAGTPGTWKDFGAIDP